MLLDAAWLGAENKELFEHICGTLGELTVHIGLV